MTSIQTDIEMALLRTHQDMATALAMASTPLVPALTDEEQERIDYPNPLVALLGRTDHPVRCTSVYFMSGNEEAIKLHTNRVRHEDGSLTWTVSWEYGQVSVKFLSLRVSADGSELVNEGINSDV